MLRVMGVRFFVVGVRNLDVEKEKIRMNFVMLG